MASTINATTSSGIVTTADNTGNLALQSGGTTIMTVTSTGVTTQVGAPAFSAYQTSGQTLSSSVWTKLLFDTEEFDTNNNFASSRFTPTVAGYYFANASTNAGNNSQDIAAIYKNGSMVRSGTNVSNGYTGIVTTLVYCNGTTDYLEAYGYMGSGAATGTGLGATMFQAFLARSA